MASYITSNYDPWSTWVNLSTTTSAISTNYTWTTWNTQTYTTASSTSDTVWISWSAGSPEQEYHQQPTQWRQQNVVEDRREKAELKAKNLLLDLIGKEQLKIYSETGRLFVKGKKFDYIIPKIGFIKRLEKDKIVDLCVSLGNKYSFPETDNVIAMKLLIEDEEDKMLDLANEQGSRPRPQKLQLAACM